MAELFKVLAGVSDESFNIGGVTFMAAPLTLLEYGEYLAAGDELDAKAEFLADKLRRRLKGNKTDPATITQDWLMENLPLPMLGVLQHILLYGETPKEDEKKAR